MLSFSPGSPSFVPPPMVRMRLIDADGVVDGVDAVAAEQRVGAEAAVHHGRCRRRRRGCRRRSPPSRLSTPALPKSWSLPVAAGELVVVAVVTAGDPAGRFADDGPTTIGDVGRSRGGSASSVRVVAKTSAGANVDHAATGDARRSPRFVVVAAPSAIVVDADRGPAVLVSVPCCRSRPRARRSCSRRGCRRAGHEDDLLRLVGVHARASLPSRHPGRARRRSARCRGRRGDAQRRLHRKRVEPARQRVVAVLAEHDVLAGAGRHGVVVVTTEHDVVAARIGGRDAAVGRVVVEDRSEPASPNSVSLPDDPVIASVPAPAKIVSSPAPPLHARHARGGQVVVAGARRRACRRRCRRWSTSVPSPPDSVSLPSPPYTVVVAGSPPESVSSPESTRLSAGCRRRPCRCRCRRRRCRRRRCPSTMSLPPLPDARRHRRRRRRACRCRSSRRASRRRRRRAACRRRRRRSSCRRRRRRASVSLPEPPRIVSSPVAAGEHARVVAGARVDRVVAGSPVIVSAPRRR